MHDGSQGNPMAEIALALAMGFFSIMVLTMVSMGTAQQSSQAVAAAILAPSTSARGAVDVETQDTVVVYHQGRYFDAQLKPVDPATLAPAGRLILAIDPALPLGEAMTARTRLAADDLIVSTLDPDWLRALKEVPR
ncbi:MAG: hypothetical protein GKS00_28590 [Alphaproteobacteria bacterium]|nr:hypothetical protein [Alphaproteobacteria bacterium]